MLFDDNPNAVICENVSYVYPDGTPALYDINLKILSEEKVAIIGPNGAGKSTLLHLLNGIRRGKGNINIFDYHLEEKNLKKIKTLVGLVFQNPDDQLFCPTIYDDVAFGPLNLGFHESEIKNRVAVALADTGLQGYEQRSSLHLSYGERKLAAMASILSMQPQLIAMDEPTSNLDPLHRRKVIHWLQSCNLTCIVTSHDLDMIIETCERVYILNRGLVVANGNVNDILSNRELLQANDLELPLKWQN
jgi:cobalt/nickel transport system ATP-binding protein